MVGLATATNKAQNENGSAMVGETDLFAILE
jgi:hypothetical protein